MKNNPTPHLRLLKNAREHNPLPGVRLLTYERGGDVVSIGGSIAGGFYSDTAFHHQRAILLARMLTQGTTRHTREEIENILEGVGARISFHAGPERISFFASCLSKDISLVLELISEQLYQPLFSEEILTKVIKRFVATEEEKNTDTEWLANAWLMQALFPENHPFYQFYPQDTVHSLKKVSVTDIKKFYEEIMRAPKIILALAGGIAHAEAQRLTSKYFRSSPENLEGVDVNFKSKIVSGKKFQNVPEKASVDLVIGNTLSIDSLHPDFIPLSVGIAVLGSGSTSRLFQNVREKAGLTYHAYGYMGVSPYTHDGYWQVGASFNPDLFGKGLSLMEEELKRFATQGISKKELADTKEMFRGRYLVGFDNTRGIVSKLKHLAEEGRSLSFLETYLENLGRVSLTEVNTAIYKHIRDKKYFISAAGSFQKAKG